MLADKLRASILFNVKRLGQNKEAGMKPTAGDLFFHFRLYSKL